MTAFTGAVAAGDKAGDDGAPAVGEVRAGDGVSHKDAGKGKSPCAHCRRPMLGSLFLLGGAAFTDMDALNGRLADNGYSTFDSPTIPLGVGFTHRWGRFVHGASWNFLLSSGFESSREDLRMDLKANYWQLQYGFDVVQWKGLSVYPLVGLGAGHMNIHISSESDDSFNGVLDDPGRSVHMRQTSFMLSAGLGVDYRLLVKETEKKKVFFTIGVRGAWLFSPYSGDWRTTGAEIHGGPHRGITGPTVQLLLGISKERLTPAGR